MPYEYYCTNCGKILSQDNVLVDTQFILSRKRESSFGILKFRMTLAEMEQMIKSGTAVEDQFLHCTLTLEQVMKYVSNERNLNDPDIAKLTIKDIKEYLGEDALRAAAVQAPTVSLEDDLFGDSTPPKPVETVADPLDDEPASVAILALEGKDTTNTDRTTTRNILRQDLKVLQNLFAESNTMSFDIKFLTELDNNHEEVVIGYHVAPDLIVGVGSDARICPKCSYPVFEHAGTAKHQTIAFFGTQSSGKTSLILSLTHYARNHMLVDFGEGGIWNGAKTIGTIKTCDLLNKKTRAAEGTSGADTVAAYRNQMLYDDLAKFNVGVAPDKTDASQGKQAYSATFRLQDYKGKFHLITLTDLPGELIDEDTGDVQLDKIETEFPAALACDAYAVCFDTAHATDRLHHINVTCRAANTIQSFRRDGSHIPMILVYTKCGDLEAAPSMLDLPDPQKGPVNFHMIRQAHMFYGESDTIAQNPAYQFIKEQFHSYENLKDAYQTGLRCSAYGFTAPTMEQVESLFPGIRTRLQSANKTIGQLDEILSEDELAQLLKPRPKHVDYLMHWLLCVSGCIPVEHGYCANPQAPMWTIPDNFVLRPQFRNQKPMSTGGDSDIREALLRCVLFENPGSVDVALVQAHNSKAALLAARTKAKFAKNNL